MDANGNTWIYGYTGSLPTTFTDPENRTITRTWVGNGELASLRYADGTGVDYKYEYDSSKTLFYKQERTTGGRVTESWINPEGEVVRQDLNGKNLKTLVTDTYARTRTETDARGLATVREYDQWDNITKITYPDGATITTTYDPVFSQPTQKTDERGIITKYEYDTKGNLLKFTEAFGLPEQRITEYTYDAYGNRLTQKRLGDTQTQEALTRYEYDNYGNVTAIVDPENYRSEFTYSAMGNSLIKKDARGKLWTKTYDNRGRITSETDPLSHTTRYEYDKSGLPIKTIDAATNESVLSYDQRGNIITATDPNGGVSRFEYDTHNQIVIRIDQAGKFQTTEYDLDGRPVRHSDGNGNTLQYIYGDEASGLNNLLIKVIYPTFNQELKYDVRNRVTEVTDVLDSSTRYTTQFGFDAGGIRTRITDKENKTTTNVYDALGRLTQITDPLAGVTTQTYDNRDNLIALKDPKDQTHHFEYDRRNLQTREIRPLGQSITYTYTAIGQPETRTDAKGQRKLYIYDDAARKTGESHYLTVDTTTPAKTISYSYNDLGTLTNWNDGVVSGGTNYDNRQLQKIGETVNYGAFSLGYSYGYGANGLKQSFTGPDNVTINYTYDNNNQLSSIALPTGSLTINAYNWTEPAQITLPGGTTRTQSYDPLLRLTGINVKDPAQNNILNYAYTYDKSDNVKTKNTEQGNYDYDYDDLYRLKQATNPSPLATEAYTYDAVGNRLTDSNILGAWAYNENNQLTAHGNATFGYDTNGNMITKTEGNITTTFVYDTNDRLIEVRHTDIAANTTTTLATYAYDPFGRRLWKEISGARTYFFYSDEGLIAEADNAGVLTKNYGYIPNSYWSTDPVYLKQGSNYFFYQNDHLGTSQKLTASDGAIVWSAKAQAFGHALVDNASSITNNLRFAGQYFDSETGLLYNWNRYYDPGLGGYVQSDPIGLNGGLNIYAYVEGNPVNLIDPEGLASTCYSQGPNCGGAGPPGSIYKSPGCFTPVYGYGAILRWEPCRPPGAPKPVCQASPFAPPPDTSGSPPSAPGSGPGSPPSSSGAGGHPDWCIGGKAGCLFDCDVLAIKRTGEILGYEAGFFTAEYWAELKKKHGLAKALKIISKILAPLKIGYYGAENIDCRRKCSEKCG